jgi:ABC-type branched-subunit amino acid transport system substrate-binding protein
MMASCGLGRAVLLAVSLMVAVQPVRAGSTLTPEEEAGRALYLTGESAYGDAFSGRLGMGAQNLPGSALRCANCHGADGLGRPEGGVHPNNITWSELTKSYGHVHEDGRRHAPFDAAMLKRALRQGVDPAGTQLDGTMPRFNISDRDFKALLAYMKKLEFQHDPGVGKETLRIGTLLPVAGRFGEMGLAVRSTLQAYLDEINKSGGIFGRKLELVNTAYPMDDRDGARRALHQLVENDNVFALLAPFAVGIEEDLGRIANEAKIPVLGPLSLFGDDPRSVNQHVFHLLSGIAELTEVLALHVGKEAKQKAAPAVLLYPDSASGAALADEVEQRLKSQGWSKLERIGFHAGAFDAAAVATALKAQGAEAVFLLGPGADIGALAQQAAKSHYLPWLLLPGALTPRSVLDLPKEFEGRVMLAYPTVPADQKPEALRQYAALFQGSKLVRNYQTSQVPAYSSAVLLVEALKQAGRDLTRVKLVSILESLQGFEPGLVPAVSFNAKRRLGAPGGYVVAVDLNQKNFRPLGGFVTLP